MGAAPDAGDVLIVEDDARLRAELRRLLLDGGHRVTTASTARLAVRALRRSVGPRVVLLDPFVGGALATIAPALRERDSLIVLPVLVAATPLRPPRRGPPRTRRRALLPSPAALLRLVADALRANPPRSRLADERDAIA